MLELRCSYLLRRGGNLIKGEFIFFVHPGIEEMSPLNLSERGILPGGFTTSSKYYSRLVFEIFIGKNKYDLLPKIKWFENSFAETASHSKSFPPYKAFGIFVQQK